MKRTIRQIASIAIVLIGGSVAANCAQAKDSCANIETLKIPGVAFTKAEHVPAGPLQARRPGSGGSVELPAYCRVEGMIDQRTGADGKTYGIGFAVAMPDDWNGRFLFEGGGGLDGVVKPPIGPTASGDKPALARGFAIASTDSGHQSKGVFDASFFADQQATLDFEYASIGSVTDLAKRLIVEHYGRTASHSYFAGCSMGGREAMIAAQRYPTEFDGVIAGAPAMRVGYSGIGDRWVAATLTSIAPKDASGTPILSKILSPSDKTLIIKSLLKACDRKDGLKDGMIFNVAACKFDPKTLICKGAKTDKCLSAAQANAIDKAFDGPKDSKGDQVYPGFFYDTGITATGFIPGLLNPGPSPLGPPSYATKIDVDKEAAQAAADPSAAIGDTAGWTNLTTFFARGGKLIFFHGVSDPWFSAKDTLGYYERMTKANGGARKVMNESRIFLVPGMGHCGGGPATLDQFNLLSPLVDWVEKGKAPKSVVATGKDFPGRSRPLCPYPQHAQYKGRGNSEEAKNFACRE
jgi:hypothetical protein